MSRHTRNKLKGSRRALFIVLSLCTVFVWSLLFYTLILAPSDTQRAKSALLVSQQAYVQQADPNTHAESDKPVQVSSVMDLEMATPPLMAINTATDASTVMPTQADKPMPTAYSSPNPSQTPVSTPTASPSPIPTAAPTATITPPPTPSPAPSPTPTVAALKVGDKGDAVKALQGKLVSLGYLSGTADGVFGKSTKAAVKDFQKSSNLKVDGIAGAATISALFSDAAIRKPAITATPEKEAPKSGTTRYVWITKTGKKYHRTSHCGNTKNARKVTLQDAQDMGYKPCQNCY